MMGAIREESQNPTTMPGASAIDQNISSVPRRPTIYSATRDMTPPIRKKLAKVPRKRGPDSCWYTIAIGGPPIEDTVPINPDSMPAVTKVVRVGRSLGFDLDRPAATG